MDSKQEKLIKNYTLHFQDHFNLGPLKSKILAFILIIGKKEGVTFDDILTFTQASKSSVSTSIICLLERNSIHYEQKPNDRKKYFKPNNLSAVLERTKRIIESELALIIDMISYYDEIKEDENDAKRVNNMKLFESHLKKIELSLQDTLDKIE